MIKKVFQKIISSKSKTFLAFCFCFMLSAGISSIFDVTIFLNHLLIIILVIIFLIILFWKYQILRWVLLCLFFLTFGAVRFFITFPDSSSDVQSYVNKKIEFQGIIIEEPDVRMDTVYYIIKTESLKENNNSSSISGRVLVKNTLYPVFEYGDEVSVTCKLQKPERMEDSTFRYDKYLAKQNIWSLCSNPQIAKIESEKANPVMSMILNFKHGVARKLEALWPEPENSFMAGILYGSRAGLPAELMENFSKTGVTHIIAVSGSNISIIAVNLMTVCIAVGLYRRKAFWVMIVLIILFVIFTGASSSVVRAGIMGIIALIAERVGRASRMTNVLIATATFMTLINPYVLVWDAGFQLSFLATVGLVYISPLLKNFVERFKLPSWKIIGIIQESLITTLAAIIATLPLILYQFGRLSLVAPLVNILILWAIPYIMFLGFSALVCSVIYLPIGKMIAWLASLLMKYIIFVVNFFGGQSWAAIDLAIPLWSMVVSYGVMYYIVIKMRKWIKV